jgi:hypothetical protein
MSKLSSKIPGGSLDHGKEVRNIALLIGHKEMEQYPISACIRIFFLTVKKAHAVRELFGITVFAGHLW